MFADPSSPLAGRSYDSHKCTGQQRRRREADRERIVRTYPRKQEADIRLPTRAAASLTTSPMITGRKLSLTSSRSTSACDAPNAIRTLIRACAG
jgi:hypothetical protein